MIQTYPNVSSLTTTFFFSNSNKLEKKIKLNSTSASARLATRFKL